MAEIEIPPGLVPLDEEGAPPIPTGLVPLEEADRPSVYVPEGLVSPDAIPEVLPDRSWRDAYEEATAKRSDEILISPEQAQLIAERNTSRPQTFTQGGMGGVLTNVLDRVDRGRAGVVGAAIAGMEGADWKAVGQELLLGLEGEQHPLMGDYIFYKMEQAQKDPHQYPGTTKLLRLLDAAGLERTQSHALISTLGGIGGDILLDPLTYTGLGTTKQGAATMIKSSLSKEGVEITNAELNRILKDMEARGEFAEYGKTLADQLERGQKQYKVAGVPVPAMVSAAVVRQVERIKDRVKATKMGDTAWRMFSTKHGLLPEHEKFAVMEERFKNVVIMGREHSITENKFLMEQIQKISKDSNIPVKDVNAFITEAIERGNLNNIDLAKVDPRAVDVLMANDDVMNTVVSLRFKNTQQIKDEINAGIRITELGATEQKHLYRIEEAVASAKANGLAQTVNPITGRKIATATLEKKAGGLRERIAVQEKLFYMNHSLTPEAKEILAKETRFGKRKAVDAGKEYSVQHASTLQRGFRNMSIVEINSLAKKGKLPGYEGTVFPNGFFYDDPAIAQAYRDFRHGRSMAAATMLKQASKEFGVSARELQALKKKTKATTIDEVIPEGYIRATHPMVRNMYFPAEIANRIDAHFTKAFNPEEVNAFLDIYDQATGWWKAWTLSIFPGYHTRNAAGNVWNNFVTGTTDPRVYNTAQQVQRGQAGNIQTVDGRVISYDQIRENLDMLGVRNRGLFTADIEQSLKEELGGGRWLTLTRDQKAIHIGRKVGEAIENNARIAKFVDELQKGKGFFDASKSTQRALFDYSDLTNFEQGVAKRLMPFYCVPDTAEALTREGWKSRDQLIRGEEILTYNVEGDYTEWQPLEDVAAFEFEGKLVALRNKRVKFLCTDDHRWPIEVNKTTIKGKDYGGDRKIVRSHELTSSHKIPLARPIKDDGKSILTPTEASLLGWLVTDGYYRFRSNGFEAMLYQSPKKHADKIRTMFSEYISSESVHPDTGVICFRLAAGKLGTIRAIFKGKESLPKIVTHLNEEAREAMYVAMTEAGGCDAGDKGKQFVQKVGPVLDAFQILCHLRGTPFNYSTTREDKSLAQGYVRSRDNLKLANCFYGAEDYKGIIWCPKTPNSTWVMRQEGRVIMTGNTWSRKNIPLQAQQLVAHPGRYKAVDTIRREIEANTPDQGEYNMANYMLDNYPARVRIDKESGNPEYFLLGSWLPAADLWKVASDPGKLGLDLLHPGAKAALEYGFGVDLFTMKELDPDKQEDFLGVKMDPRIKKALSNMRIITTVDDLIFSSTRPEHLLATTRNMTLEEKIMHFATGVKLYSQDPTTNKMFKMWEKGARLKDLRKDMRSEYLKHQDPDQLDDMTEKMVEEYLENLDEILSGTGRPQKR